MKEKILEKIYELEKAKNVKVLYACESGSRAWGFPSPDSDYDARFIYVKPLSSYLSIVESDGQIGYPVDDVFDISGWDLQKTLRLVRKCNATPFEWLQSPMVYFEESGFKEELFSLGKYYFNQKAMMHHYLGITKGALANKTPDGQLSIKKFFYVLRPLLAAMWTLEKNEIPPMNIESLKGILPLNLQGSLAEIIDRKSSSLEIRDLVISSEFNQFIGDHMTRIATIEFLQSRQDSNPQLLDHFLTKSIYAHDH